MGDGDVLPEFRALAEAKGISEQALFTGLKDRSQVFEYIKNFDIALQPAVTESALPLKLFKYMAAGFLIVAPRWASICVTLDDDCALFL